jgi:hypothetical protein
MPVPVYGPRHDHDALALAQLKILARDVTTSKP